MHTPEGSTFRPQMDQSYESTIRDPKFRTDNFMMYGFKIAQCSRQGRHPWCSCPFAHPTENARRRDPRLYNYTCNECQSYRCASPRALLARPGSTPAVQTPGGVGARSRRPIRPCLWHCQHWQRCRLSGYHHAAARRCPPPHTALPGISSPHPCCARTRQSAQLHAAYPAAACTTPHLAVSL